MYLRGITALAAAIGLLASACVAQAQLFDYTTLFAPGPITTNQPGSQINIFNASGSNVFADANGTDIVLANFTTTSNALASNPALVNSDYTISVLLAKSAFPGAQSSSPLEFHGHLGGSFSSENANVTNSFNGSGPQTIDLGPDTNGVDQVFTIQLGSYVAPGPPSQTLRGAITAHIFGPNSPQVADTPEPGTLAAFIGLGITSTLVVIRRRRKEGVKK
jgi:hypothetical protein